jgi:hypothetical protein
MRKYTSITANLNKDGSPQIIAWYKEGRTLSFERIPLSNGRGGEITKVAVVSETPASDR